VAGVRGGLDEFRPANLLVPLRRKGGDHQVASVIVDKETVAVPHDETGCPSCFFLSQLQALPNAFTRAGIQTSQLTVATDTINVVTYNYRSGDERVQTVGVGFAATLASPQH